MEKLNLEELLLEAAENHSDEVVNRISKLIADVDDINSDDLPDNIEFMLENWEGKLSEAQAELCLQLAEKGLKESAIIRKAVGDSIKRLLPPFLSGAGFFRALGIHGPAVPLDTIVRRYRQLINLKNGLVIYLPTSSLWGKIDSIDGFASSVAVNGIVNRSAYAIPLEVILDSAYLFPRHHEVIEIAEFNPNRKISSERYREVLKKHIIGSISDEDICKIAHASLAGVFSQAEFDKWWSLSAPRSSNGGERSVGHARSIHELHILAAKQSEAGLDELSDEEVELLRILFGRIRLPASLKEEVMLCEALAMIAPAMSDSQLTTAVTPLIDRVKFFPRDVDNIQLEALEVWGKIKVKYLAELGRLVSLILDKKAFVAYVVRLPLRCLNVFCKFADQEILRDEIMVQHCFSCDILLWIWRNRKKVDKELLQALNISDVVKALSQKSLPKAWLNAQKELKKLLIDNASFQKLLLEHASDNIADFVVALQNGDFFESGEQQSLLVKLSRTSPALREALEGGGAAKIFAGSNAQEAPRQPDSMQPIVTSFASHRRLLKELEEIKTIHIPENREALKTAREHGDFRENAEYDAAKERRDFLAGRRDELESTIANIQPTDFRTVRVEDSVVIGCQVELLQEDGSVVTYYLLGAFDGNPEEQRISYQTPFGQSLLGKKVGDKVTMPNGMSYTVAAVKALPEAICKSLD